MSAYHLPSENCGDLLCSLYGPGSRGNFVDQLILTEPLTLVQEEQKIVSKTQSDIRLLEQT
jgi:hypothetical protein